MIQKRHLVCEQSLQRQLQSSTALKQVVIRNEQVVNKGEVIYGSQLLKGDQEETARHLEVKGQD